MQAKHWSPMLFMVGWLLLAAWLTACGGSEPLVQETRIEPPTATPTEPVVPSPTAAMPTPTHPTRDLPTPTPTAAPAFVVDERGNLWLGDRMVVNTKEVAPGCFSGTLLPSPRGDYVVFLLSCIEGENEAYLVSTDGQNVRRITDQWDAVNGEALVWSPTGREFVYERINACCIEPPPTAPQAGLVLYDVATGEKRLLAANVHLTPLAWSPDGRWLAFLDFRDAPFGAERAGKLYILDVVADAAWIVDEQVEADECATLTWEAQNEGLVLVCVAADGKKRTEYRIPSGTRSLEPPGTPMPIEALRPPNPPEERYRVVRVAEDDVLNVRSGPGVAYEIVGALPPNAEGVRITGEPVQVNDSFWVPIEWNGVSGWVNGFYLAPMHGEQAP
nr:SH3 domain-containing protein [Ardenticatena sp.]